MMDLLRPVLGRVVAGWVTGLAGFLAVRFGFTLDADTQAALVGVVIGVLFSVYSLLHKMIDSKINPVDAASVDSAARTKTKHEGGQL